MSTTAPGSGPRPRNRRGEGARLREDIVRAAALLLTEEGGEQAVTLRSVARRVGISATSIYPHFPDRDAILLAVTQEAFAELEQQLRHAAHGSPHGAPDHEQDSVDQLRAVCRAYLDFAHADPQRYRVMFGGVWNAEHALELAPDRREDLTQLGMGTFDALVEAVRRCIDAGHSADADPATGATALWVGLHGHVQLRSAAPLFPWPPDFTEQLITRLVRLTDGHRS